MLGKKRCVFFLGFILTLFCVTSSFAMESKPDHIVFVTVPHFSPTFEVSLAALALKPGASNLNYVILNKELPAQSPTWAEQELKPDYSFAFELAGRYLFSEGKDVHLAWTHLNSSTSSSVAATSADYFLGPDYQIGPDATIIRNATGKAKFKYDVVNLDVGQLAHFGQHVEMRFFGGLSDAFLREEVISTYSGSVLTGLFTGPFSTEQTVNANFVGIGPRFGLGGSYNTHCGFSFYGEAALSALIGSSYAKTSYVSSSVELLTLFGQTTNEQTIKDQNVMQVVPGLDAKLGVNYEHAFNNTTLLTVGAGYQAAVYVNAINQYIPGSLVDGASIETGGIFVATMSHTQSNYSVQGPFLQATIRFS